MTDQQEALQKALERTGKQLIESVEKFNTAVAKAAEQYRKVFETVAESLPGWTVDQEHWNYNPNPEEIKTREKAFEGICKRRKKGKVVRR